MFLTPFQSQTFVAPELKSGVNNVISDQLEISWLPQTSVTPIMEPFLLLFLHLEKNPHKLVDQGKAAALFRCEAPDVICWGDYLIIQNLMSLKLKGQFT